MSRPIDIFDLNWSGWNLEGAKHDGTFQVSKAEGIGQVAIDDEHHVDTPLNWLSAFCFLPFCKLASFLSVRHEMKKPTTWICCPFGAVELSRRRHQLTQKPTARWSEGEFYLKIYIRVGCSFISTSQPPHYHQKATATATAAAASQSSSLGRVTLTPPESPPQKEILYDIAILDFIYLHFGFTL